MDAAISNQTWFVIKNKPLQEELFLWICLGSLKVCLKPFNALNEKHFVPSAVSMSLDQNEVNLGLKLPNMTKTDGLLCIDVLNFSLFWLRER